MVSTEKYRDDLLRTISLIHFGWKVFRWSDKQLVEEPERVKEHLRLFIQDDLVGNTFDGYLPTQNGELLSLHEHQSDALECLEKLRSDGNNIVFVKPCDRHGENRNCHTGRKKIGKRTLYLVHTNPIANQTLKRFQEFWPEVISSRYAGGPGKPESYVVIPTYQAIQQNLTLFAPESFGYIIADEATMYRPPHFALRWVISRLTSRLG